MSLCLGGTAAAISLYASGGQRLFVGQSGSDNWQFHSDGGIRSLGAWNYVGATVSQGEGNVVMKTRVCSTLSQFLMLEKRYANKHVVKGGSRATC
jgi:hypothetical protein